MAMKKYAMAAMIVAALSAHAAPKHHDQYLWNIDNPVVSVDGSALHVGFTLDLDSLSVPSERALVFTPVLYNGNDSIELHSVGVYGKRRYVHYERRSPGMITGIDEQVLKNADKPAKLDYEQSVAYQEWMNGVRLKVRYADYGCCFTALTEGERTLPAGYMTAPTTMRPAYVSATADSIVEKEIEGSAYVQFIVDRTEIRYDFRDNARELAKITSSTDIYGDTETPIGFYYKPAGKIPVDQQRGGIIEISYHNNTCVHRIIVKQGYAPVQMIDGRDPDAPHAKWSNFNMRDLKEMCLSPLEEGSYFRAGKQSYPIDPSTTWSLSVKGSASTMNLYPSETKTWSEIGMTALNVANTKHFGSWTYSRGSKETYPGKYQVAELQDFFYLRNNMDDWQVTSEIEIAYGIAYADGATEPQTNPDLAHGYKYNEGVSYEGDYPTSVRGMRGCFVYNNGAVGNLAGNSLFFPSGVKGYGRLISNNTNSAAGTGFILRYGRGRGVAGAITNDMNFRPLLHRLDINFGMIYWHRRYHKTGYGTNSAAWDFNMSTFDFNTFGANGNYDACMVRMVLNTEDAKYKAQDTPVFPTYPHNK